MNFIEDMTKQEIIKSIEKLFLTPEFKHSEHTEEENNNYKEFMVHVNKGEKSEVVLPLDFALKDDLFSLIKEGKVFIKNSVKFNGEFTTEKPAPFNKDVSRTVKSYMGNEFFYSFLDNHKGILNVDRLRDIPVDYEGFMAVPMTVLVYKHLQHFNIHKIIYTPKHNGKLLYPRVVVTRKESSI